MGVISITLSLLVCIAPQSLFLSFVRNILRRSHFLVRGILRRVCARDLGRLVLPTQRKAVVTTHKEWCTDMTDTNKQTDDVASTCCVSANAHRSPSYRLPPCMTPLPSTGLCGCVLYLFVLVPCACYCACWHCGFLCTGVPRRSSPHRMSDGHSRSLLHTPT